MTRKNYIAIANIIKNQLSNTHHIMPLVNTLSSYFADDNERFDKVKFRNACLNGNKIADKILVRERSVTEYYEDRNPVAEAKVNRLITEADLAFTRMVKKNERVSKKIRKKN